MKHTDYEYEVKPVLELTRDEVQALVAMALWHYDSHCQSFAQPNGLLRKFEHLFENNYDNGRGVIKVSVTSRELDTLCKIAEQDTLHPSRWDGLRETLTATSKEWERLNNPGNLDDATLTYCRKQIAEALGLPVDETMGSWSALLVMVKVKIRGCADVTIDCADATIAAVHDAILRRVDRTQHDAFIGEMLAIPGLLKTLAFPLAERHLEYKKEEAEKAAQAARNEEDPHDPQ